MTAPSQAAKKAWHWTVSGQMTGKEDQVDFLSTWCRDGGRSALLCCVLARSRTQQWFPKPLRFAQAFKMLICRQAMKWSIVFIAERFRLVFWPESILAFSFIQVNISDSIVSPETPVLQIWHCTVSSQSKNPRPPQPPPNPRPLGSVIWWQKINSKVQDRWKERKRAGRLWNPESSVVNFYISRPSSCCPLYRYSFHRGLGGHVISQNH